MSDALKTYDQWYGRFEVDEFAIRMVSCRRFFPVAFEKVATLLRIAVFRMLRGLCGLLRTCQMRERHEMLFFLTKPLNMCPHPQKAVKELACS